MNLYRCRWDFIQQIRVRFRKQRKLKEITYDEMLDLATLRAGVLHNRSVEMAKKKYGVPLGGTFKFKQQWKELW